jgi:hypothetical protein
MQLPRVWNEELPRGRQHCNLPPSLCWQVLGRSRAGLYDYTKQSHQPAESQCPLGICGELQEVIGRPVELKVVWRIIHPFHLIRKLRPREGSDHLRVTVSGKAQIQTQALDSPLPR